MIPKGLSLFWILFFIMLSLYLPNPILGNKYGVCFTQSECATVGNKINNSNNQLCFENSFHENTNIFDRRHHIRQLCQWIWRVLHLYRQEIIWFVSDRNENMMVYQKQITEHDDLSKILIHLNLSKVTVVEPAQTTIHISKVHHQIHHPVHSRFARKVKI